MRLLTLFQLLALTVCSEATSEEAFVADPTSEAATDESKPFIPLNPLDLLDEEIETLRALIESYDNKITILEDKNSSSAPSSVNAKGKRVKAEEV